MSTLTNPTITGIKVYLAIGVILSIIVASQLISHLKLSRALSRYPLVNPKWGPAEKAEFTTSAASILAKGVEMAKGKPFRLNEKSRPRLVIPPKYMDEIKNDKRLDFHDFVAKEFFSTYPGFDGFSADQTIFQDAVRTQLTQALALTIQPIAAETPNTLNLVYGSAPDWQEIVLTPALLKSISRLSALIFLGESFMNNPDWQRISVMYTVDVFMAAKALNNWPAPLRPIVHWFLPECRKIREEVKVAKDLIQPEVDKRRKELAENEGKPRRKVLDSVDWFTASAKGREFGYANAELSLAMAAIHTTSNTLGFAMFDLVENPEYFDLLREEIKRVWEEDGRWEKNTLYKLKLMDSVLKESMRLHPHSLLKMPRQAKEEISLSDGITIPKSAFISMGPVLMKDPTIFPNVDKFDGHRFLNLRNAPGNENKHQFVTTSPECNVFGHGQHACPGRFFASNEIKLLLAHMVMYYDWKLPDGQTSVQHTKNGVGESPNSRQKILFKSRKPELDVSCAMKEA
ncbi:trichothecene C-8 hydroxylase [Mollisia scopiformis]|uniref:Trichothecene C-8 hydroxylase n=1 Tax=Mollisia scopiformis TaxID=149040 RepID=A0A194XNL5_MOLSC|nr:trichothecene C-8 hydroxylase [Mollisia scopiformis]KUJ21322.1 trichothecene C-8 hydroxylase [Mollisia scopiformis]